MEAFLIGHFINASSKCFVGFVESKRDGFLRCLALLFGRVLKDAKCMLNLETKFWMTFLETCIGLQVMKQMLLLALSEQINLISPKCWLCKVLFTSFINRFASWLETSNSIGLVLFCLYIFGVFVNVHWTILNCREQLPSK